MKALKFTAVLVLSLLFVKAAQAQLSPGSKGTLKLDVEVQDELGIDTVSQVVELRHIRASEIQPFIQARLSRWGAVQVNDALNMVIITDKKPKLVDLVDLVHKLDSPGLKDFLRLETVSIPLKYAYPDTVRSLVLPQLSPEGSLLIDLPHNALVITDLRSKIDSIQRSIEKIDVFVPQVVIEASIVEISSDYMHKVGIDWNALRLVSGSAQASISGSSVYSPVYGNWSMSGSLDVNRFMDLVNFLANQNKAKILSTTKIATANGEIGTITAGQKVYFRQTGTSGENNQVGGLIVQIIPRIGSENNIALDVNASLDDLTGWSQNGNPIFESRSAKSKIALKEGETFVLGGIERNTVIDTDNGIPILKDILPFIFSSRGHTNLKSQVLILLTPHVMRSPGQASSADLDTYNSLKSKTNPPSLKQQQ
jgi:type II secretory pathway component GspD/PulD (secretin)